MSQTMFSTEGWEKVTYCKYCQHSYTPMTVPIGEDTPVVTSCFCEITNRMVKDYGYCDAGI